MHQLAEGHTEELVLAAEMMGLSVTIVFFNELQKIIMGHEFEYLGNDIFSSVRKNRIVFAQNYFSNRLNLKNGHSPLLGCISKMEVV